MALFRRAQRRDRAPLPETKDSKVQRLIALTLSGAVQVRWKRRTRIGGDDWGSAEVSLSEVREVYRLEVVKGAAVLRTLEVNQTQWLYGAADQLADFTVNERSLIQIRVSQGSDSYGWGVPTQASLL